MARSLILLLILSSALRSQELPDLTASRRRHVETLLHACVAERAFAEGTNDSFTLLDRSRLKKLLVAHPEWLKSETRETLAAFWPSIHQDSEPAYIALLEEFAAASGDLRARGLAAMLKGISAKRDSLLEVAVMAYMTAVEHYRSAGELAWAAQCLVNLGEVYTLQGSYSNAVEVGHQGLEMFRNLYPPSRYPDGHRMLALAIYNLGHVYELQGAYAESEGYMRQTLAMGRKLYPPSEFPDGHPQQAQTLDALARLGFLSGDLVEATSTARFALAVHRKLHPESVYPKGHPRLVDNLEGLGLILASRGYHDEATTNLKQALEMHRGIYKSFYPNGHPHETALLDRLGTLLYSRGDLEGARSHFMEASRIRQAIYPVGRFPNGHPLLAISRFQLGMVHESRNHHDKALQDYEEAIQLMRLPKHKGMVRLDDGPSAAPLLIAHPDTVRFLSQRAALLVRVLPIEATSSQLRKADHAIALAVAVQERLRSEVMQREADKIHHRATVDHLLTLRVGLLARLAALEKRPDTLSVAFQAIESGRARVFLESLGEANASRLVELPKPLQNRERSLAVQLREIEARITRLQELPGDEPARQVQLLYVERRQKEGEQQKLIEELRDRFPAYSGYRYPSACTLQEARECLNEKEAAILFTVAEEVSYALIVDKNAGLNIVRMPGSKELNPLVAALLEPETLQRPARARETATELFQKLLGPLAQHIEDRDLVLVPDGVLHLLPFEMLYQPTREKERGRWLIETRGIRYVPSLTVLHLARQAEKKRKSERALSLWALGDPIFDTNDPRYKPEKELQQNLAFLRGFPRLEQSGTEVKSICKALSAPADVVLLDDKATEASVKAASKSGELARAKYLHFATHGIVSERSAHATGLLLSRMGNDFKEDQGGLNDGFLRVPEVSFLKLNADLVVLSACETGQGRRARAEGVSGLARAFLYAGSRAVVCSLWTVDDARTSELMTELYRELKKGTPPSKALRSAQVKMIEDGAAPFFWAPFVYLGQ